MIAASVLTESVGTEEILRCRYLLEKVVETPSAELSHTYRRRSPLDFGKSGPPYQLTRIARSITFGNPLATAFYKSDVADRPAIQM